MTRTIVLISLKYPPVYSGYGRQLRSVINAFDYSDNKYKFILLTAYDSSQIESNENLEVVSFGINPSFGSSRLTYTFAWKIFLWLHRNARRYALIHCIKAGPEAISANVIGKLKKKPVIIKVAQDELSDKELNTKNPVAKAVKLMRHALIKSADVFIAISAEIRDNLSRRVASKSEIATIPNGVDTEKFKPVTYDRKKDLRQELSIPQDETVVLFVGAINRRKGVHDLLKAADTLSNETKARIILCGPQLEDIDFERKQKDINRTHKNVTIDYRGSVDNIEDYMRASDLFVLPSYSEGLPNVVLEAGATGLPLIGTDIGGTRDIISQGDNGYIVELGNPADLSEAMRQLIDHESIRSRMAINSREAILKRFSINDVSAKYKKLYDALI